MLILGTKAGRRGMRAKILETAFLGTGPGTQQVQASKSAHAGPCALQCLVQG